MNSMVLLALEKTTQLQEEGDKVRLPRPWQSGAEKIWGQCTNSVDNFSLNWNKAAIFQSLQLARVSTLTPIFQRIEMA